MEASGISLRHCRAHVIPARPPPRITTSYDFVSELTILNVLVIKIYNNETEYDTNILGGTRFFNFLSPPKHVLNTAGQESDRLVSRELTLAVSHLIVATLENKKYRE